MNNLFYNATILILLLFVLAVTASSAHANMNPCEYMNMNANAEHKLDTGNDPNFTRIVQQNNQELIRACQEYEISRLRMERSDIGASDVYAPVPRGGY